MPAGAGTKLGTCARISRLLQRPEPPSLVARLVVAVAAITALI
jgi:hypothetical protein